MLVEVFHCFGLSGRHEYSLLCMRLYPIGHGWWAGRNSREGSGLLRVRHFSVPFQWHPFSSLLELAEGTQSQQPSTGLD